MIRIRVIQASCLISSILYQITLLLISLPFNMLFAYATFAPILVLYVPDQYHCSVDPALVESGNWTVEALEAWYIPRSEEARKCKMYDRLPPPPLFESEASGSILEGLDEDLCLWRGNLQKIMLL